MNLNSRFTRFAALAAIALSLAACAHQGQPASASMLPKLDAVLRGSSADSPLQVRLEKDQIRTGESISLGAASPKGGYLYIFQLGTEGQRLSLIFPNAMDGANYLAPNTVMQLPRDQWRMSTSGPAGVGYVLAVITAAPLNLMTLQANTQQGLFDLPAGYGATLVPWRELAPQP